MGKLGQLFLKGLTAVLPAALTVYVLWWLGAGAERLFGGLLQRVAPDLEYVPGIGLALGFAVVVGVGVLMNAWLVRRVVRALEKLVERVPLVKTIYGSVKDMMSFFRGGGARKDMSQVVAIEVAGTRLVGLVTRESVAEIAPPKDGAAAADEVAVYLPMSYQLGGFMVLVPRARVEPLDLSVEDALRVVVTAGVKSVDE